MQPAILRVEHRPRPLGYAGRSWPWMSSNSRRSSSAAGRGAGHWSSHRPNHASGPSGAQPREGAVGGGLERRRHDLGRLAQALAQQHRVNVAALEATGHERLEHARARHREHDLLVEPRADRLARPLVANLVEPSSRNRNSWPGRASSAAPASG